MFKTLFSLSGLSILGHLVALLSQIVLSRMFGTGREMDIFYYALTIVTTFSFFTAPISEAAVPQLYSKSVSGKQSESKQSHSHYFSQVCNLIFILGSIMSILVILFLEFFPKTLIENSLLPDLGTIRFLSYSLLPMIFLTMLTGFGHSALNSFSRFIFQQITRTVGALIGLALMVFLLPLYGINVLLATTLIPFFILLIGQYFDFKKLGFSYSFTAGIVDNSKFYKVLVALSGTFFLFSVYLIYEKWVLANLGVGLVSAYTYAQKLSLVPQLVFSSSIITVVATRVLEKLHQETTKIAVFDTLNIAAVSFGLCFFLGAGLSVYARQIIYLFFYGGAFGADSLEVTSIVFQIMILAFPWIVLYGILNRIITSQQKAKMLGMIGLLQCLLLFIGAYWTKFSGRIEVMALFNIIVFAVLAVMLLIYLRVLHGSGVFRFFIRKSYLLVFYSILCAAINWKIQLYIGQPENRLVLALKLLTILTLFSLPVLLYLRRILADLKKIAPEAMEAPTQT